ncbi:DUF2637 domain-containing protein [Actinomadura macrotermitis]|uniref:DUF2637 domain-containing protein n=1 Tax=Actinomadura macrotermitis TaxID=2585200 RepID=A0A7K0BSY0_9ACTN|nr:DUF2637 domain-containing protein [Actinomadura macrotermitis]MQY04146.1 hypothetical protein [Actinomadura macrotermitis]
MNSAKLWATGAFGLGVAVSISANVAHTYHPGADVIAAAHQAGGYVPPIGAQVAAAFYPLALLLVVELLARMPWPGGWWWRLARYGGTGLVAAVAAVVSYRHMAALLAAYGEDELTSRIGPAAVDGLMVVASFALLALGREATTATTPAEAPAERPALPAVADETADPGTDDAPAEQEERGAIGHGSATWTAWPLPALQVADDDAAGAVPGVDLSHPGRRVADDGHAGHDPIRSLADAVRSASASGLSRRRIAEEFEISRHRVNKILGPELQPEMAGASTARPINGHPVDHPPGTDDLTDA